MSGNFSGSPAIELEALTKSFQLANGDEIVALHPADLSVSAGQIVGLLGMAGAGKSTLLKLAAGVLAPTGGAIRFSGQPLSSTGAVSDANKLTYLEQPGWIGFPPGQTVRQVLELEVNPAEQETVGRTLESLGLAPYLDREVESLPQTIQNRLPLVRALNASSEIILLDELPAMDNSTAQALSSWWPDQVHARDQAVLLATRQPEVALLLCDRVVLLRQGEVVYDQAVSALVKAGGPTGVRITVAGRLDDGRTSWFDGFRISYQGGCTRLEGPVADPSALYGLLTRLRDLGLALESVQRLDAGPLAVLEGWLAE